MFFSNQFYVITFDHLMFHTHFERAPPWCVHAGLNWWFVDISRSVLVSASRRWAAARLEADQAVAEGVRTRGGGVGGEGGRGWSCGAV